MPDDEVQGIGGADPERRKICGGEVQTLEGGVEERSVEQAGLDQTVGGAQDEDRGPAPAGPPRHFPDEQGAAAVQRDEERQRGEIAYRHVAQQILADQRGQQGQPEHGPEAAATLRIRSDCGCSFVAH